jgi:outer membrane protein OmpA-like peptidoglycan-associated protein
MNKKILLAVGLLAIGITDSFNAIAQNYLHKYGIELSGGIREYGGDRGTRYFFAERPDYQAVGGSFSYYVNPSFDAAVYGAFGTLGHRDDQFPRKLGFTANVTDLMLGLRYKFNNNYIMPEDSRIKPYIQGGWGGMQSVSKIIHDVDGYSLNYTNNRTWFAAQWSAGLGVRVAITDAIDFSLQSMYNYTFDDNYDGLPFSLSRVKLSALHDAYLYHSAGFVFNFGENEGAYKFGKKDEQVPKEVVQRLNLLAKSIHFETESATVKTESYSAIDSIVDILMEYPTVDCLIEGHTDNIGDVDANLKLSQDRANSVLTYITGKNIESSRLKAIGYGETQPAVGGDNKTPEGRALNRRVMIKPYYRK